MGLARQNIEDFLTLYQLLSKKTDSSGVNYYGVDLVEELAILRDYYINDGDGPKISKNPKIICYGITSKGANEGHWQIVNADLIMRQDFLITEKFYERPVRVEGMIKINE